MPRFISWCNALTIIAALILHQPASQAAPPDLVNQMKAMAGSKGKIILGELTAFKNTFLSDLTIQTPTISAEGSVTGTATFAGREAPVLLQYIEGTPGSIGQWLLVWRLPTQNINQLFPATDAIASKGLKMGSPLFLVSPKIVTTSSTAMSSAVRDFYREVYGSDSFTLEVQDGISLVSAIDVDGEVLQTLRSLGVSPGRLILEGVVLKNFDAARFNQARKDSKFLSELARSTELRARLSSAKLSSIPDSFQVRDMSLVITPTPAVGLGFNMLIGAGQDQRQFECRGMFQGGKNGETGLTISARSNDARPWRNALGIDGLEIHGVGLELKQQYSKVGPQWLIGVRGDIRLAGKMMSASGGMGSSMGKPTPFFRGSLDSLTRHDLMALASDAVLLRHHAKPVNAGIGSLIPDFALRDVQIVYAPMGGSTELGVPDGVGLKGQLYLFGKRMAEVDGLIDVVSLHPRTTIKAKLARIDLGPVILHDSELDMLMATSLDTHFLLKGGSDLLGHRVAARAALNAKKSELTMTGKLANLFEVDVLCSADNESQAWQFAAGFKSDFNKTFGSKVSDDIKTWARKTEQDFTRAQADLEKAQRDVNRINADIARAQAQVKADRMTNEKALQKAKADLDRISTEIEKMQAQVKRERSVHLIAIDKARRDLDQIDGRIAARRKAVQALRERDLASVKANRDLAKSHFDRAETAFKAAEAAWKSASGVNKIRLGIDKDAKGVERDVKKTAYNIASRAFEDAQSNLRKLSVDLDPAILGMNAERKLAQAALDVALSALKAIHGNTPIDADPRVASLFIKRDSAKSAVTVAQKAFDLVHHLPIDADPRVAQLFVARDTATAGLTVAKAAVDATGDTVQWAAKATAAIASGQFISIENARAACSLAVFQNGGKMEFTLKLRVMNEPRVLSLKINTQELQKGLLFTLAAEQLIPAGKSGKSK